MYKLLPLILLVACIPEIETVIVPVEIVPFICIDGWKYNLQNEILVDEFGAAIECAIN